MNARVLSAMKNLVHHFDLNTLGRDFVVGDLHGMYDMLMEALRDHDFDQSKDRLFSVGDLVDRGPNSLECARLVDEPWFFAVRGNHELMLRRFVKAERKRLTGSLDGSEASFSENYLNQYGGLWAGRVQFSWNFEQADPDMLWALSKRLAHLPMMIDVQTRHGLVGLLHGDPPMIETRPGADNPYRPMAWGDACAHVAGGLLSNANIVRITQGREIESIKNLSDPERRFTVAGLHQLYSGHTIVPRPLSHGNRTWVDTGAHMTVTKQKKGGSLTVLLIA